MWDWGHAALLQSTGASFLAQSCAPDHGVHRGDADDGSGDDLARSCVTFLYGPRACLSPSTAALAAACKYFVSFRVPGYQWRLVRARARSTNGVSSVCARAVCSIVVAIILTPVLVLVFFCPLRTSLIRAALRRRWTSSFIAVDVMEAMGNASERHLFMQFYSHLGIEDETQLVFLSTMLRAVFDATSKLDRHLAKYGASLHCAVSRMVVSKNPREAPSHRWIRVLDRLGFFTDGDKHAERIINIGMSFAYRQLEVDALADANAVLLRQALPSKTVANGEGGSALRPGGAVGSTSIGDKAAAAAADLPAVLDNDLREGEEATLPTGGLVVSADPAPSDGAGGGDRGDGGEPPLPLGGMVVSSNTDGQLPTTGVRPSSLGAAGGGGGGHSALDGGRAKAPPDHGEWEGGEHDQGDADADDGGGAGPVPSHVVHERQPTVLPPASAVAVVASVIQDVASRSGGPDVLRKLFDDSILCVARTGPPTPSHRGLVCPTGSKADWAAVTRMCTGWWPQWIATPDVPTLPPVGTVSRRLFKNRLARTSRWVLMVDMEAINKTLDDISVRSSRFFPKTKLSAVDEVVRINATSAMRLPVVVAAMLLLCTKEDRFAGVLSELASVGRVDINKAAPLHQASRHEFSSSGLAPASTTSHQGAPSRRPSPPDASTVAAAVLHDGVDVNMDEKYADMELALHNEGVSVAALNRADRMRKMRASQTVLYQSTRPAPIGVPPGTGDAEVLAAVASTSAPPRPLPTAQDPPPSSAAPSASQRSGVSAGRPPKGVKRSRAPRPPRRAAAQGAAAKATAAKAAVAKAAAAEASTAEAAAATAGGAVSTGGSGSATGPRQGDAAPAGMSASGAGVVQMMSGAASTAAASLPFHPPPFSHAIVDLTNAMAAASGGRPHGHLLGVGASPPAVGVVDWASLQQASGATQQGVTLSQPDAPHAPVSPCMSPADATNFSHQGAGLIASAYSPLHAGVGGSGVAGVPSETGGSAEHAPPSTPLSFAEESRARRARVEADLRDANASLTHILRRQGGGAGQN